MSQARLRLLYSSNAFWAASGYGVQGKSLLPRLAELPEFGGNPGSVEGRKNIAGFFWYGLQGGIHHVDGFACYPAGNDPYGNDVIGRHTKHHGANIVVSLIDVWVMRDTAKAIAPALWLPWLPIDHEPIPQRVLESLQGAYMPLSYSKWGRDMLTKAGIANHYIPHGIETSIYRVLTPRETILDFKRQLCGVDNAHLSVIVAANKGFPDRKWFQGQLRAWADFAKDKPNAYLYIHTEPTQLYGGIDFSWLLGHLGIGDKVRFPDRYENFVGIPPQYLAMIYNAADVLMSCSMSEGFGIPIVEAGACGTPVVVTDFSAMPELVRWGHKVRVADYVLTPMNAYQAWPDVVDMTDKLNSLYAEWEQAGGDWPIEKRQETSALIHEEYSWDTIVRDQWAPLMTKLADEAPPLAERFQVQASGDWRNMDSLRSPQAQRDSMGDFVGMVQSELAKDTASASKPKRRVAPLTKQPVTTAYETLSNEEMNA
jgi:glycosyltransferase involved in cell wall biosynthesis